MSTQLGTYCQQFDSTLRPVLQDLAAAVAATSAAGHSPARSLHAPLVDLHHQLEALCDKVKEQQAYVLIFGPLKSGKSTLMNAIAAAYVSEVSSLPAYPCLVFVRAGDERGYTVTSYDGTARTFAAGRELHEHIQKAHTDLAQAIRRAEQGGVAFDPQEHFPVAIRSVEVRIPGTELATTGAVLVDTPGLYTRMRFGYDRMTRDFRHSAACAIFVVKSDTLFLEQVFTEFEQLLDLFSRIFLVVNVDSHKRDLSPDGRLVPSLEQSQPEAVVRAFEQLAMSAPMQRAAGEGRVRMYPVDLMRAASSVLQKQPEQAPPGFHQFRQDLADYLASSDYLTAFLRDSLHRANALLGEATHHASGTVTARLEERLAEVEEQLAFVVGEQKRVERALHLDWGQVFARGEHETQAEVERCARDAGAKLLRTLGASIDTWFLSSQSLDWLVSQQWTPLVQDYREEVLAAGMRAFDQQQAQTDAGLDWPSGMHDLVRRAGIDLRQLRAIALARLGNVAWTGDATVPVDVGAIPVRKAMVDIVSFRSLDRVRERLFGSASKPDTKIPGKDKASRLGEPGRLHLHQCVTAFRRDLGPRTAAVLRQFFGPDLRKSFEIALREQLSAYEPRLREQQQELEAQRKGLLAITEPLRRLAGTSGGLQQTLTELGKRFDHEVKVEPEAPQKPVVLEPQPRRERLEPKGQPTRPGRRTEKTG
ncbi:MAG TPA: dynamin family protein [Planctomycetota bacterium]